MLVPPEQISCVHLLLHIVQATVIPISDDESLVFRLIHFSMDTQIIRLLERITQLIYNFWDLALVHWSYNHPIHRIRFMQVEIS